MKCNRCGKPCRPSASGFGPRCERYVLGTKPKRAPSLFSRRSARRDEQTADLFEAAPTALVSE